MNILSVLKIHKVRTEVSRAILFVADGIDPSETVGFLLSSLARMQVALDAESPQEMEDQEEITALVTEVSRDRFRNREQTLLLEMRREKATSIIAKTRPATYVKSDLEGTKDEQF